jgi:hypothetical protein
MIKKITLVLILLFLPINIFSSEKLKTPKAKTSRKIGFSYIIPGIEQIKRGYYFKGGVLFASFVSIITEGVIENKRGNDYYNIYINSVDIDEIIKTRALAEKHFKKRNYYIIGGVSVWLINLVDLKFFSKNRGIKGEIKKNYISFGFYYIF